MMYERTGTEYLSTGTLESNRTLKAYKQIVNNVRSDKNDIDVNSNIEIKKIDNDWIQNDNNVELKFIAKSKLSGDVNINYDTDIEGLNLVNVKNEKVNSFKNEEIFKLTVPIQNLKKDGKINLNIIGKLKNYPVLYGKTTIPGTQDFAISGMLYENVLNKKMEIEILKNNTGIEIIKLDEDSKEKLENIEFEIKKLDTNTIYKEKTDKEGKIILNNLLPGKYVIKEVKTKEGYKNLEKEINVILNLNEKLSINITNKKENIEQFKSYKEKKNLNFKVYTEKKKLPKTGY